MQYDFDEIAFKTGVSSQRIIDSIRTYETVSSIIPKLELVNQPVGLYGGTALNEIYYAKRQRLSYDIDLFCYSYESTFNFIKKLGAAVIINTKKEGNKRAKLRLNGIDIDMWSAKDALEKPAKRELTNLLYYFGYLVPPVVVPSYSMEYLLAEKTIAMADRNMLKDIYDLWLGLKILKDRKKYINYMEKIGKRADIDIFTYVPAQLEFMSKNARYYEKEKIDVLYQPPARLMINEIKMALSGI